MCLYLQLQLLFFLAQIVPSLAVGIPSNWLLNPFDITPVVLWGVDGKQIILLTIKKFHICYNRKMNVLMNN